MITIQGSQAGISTIRNISLIHRSISRTMQRIDRGDSIDVGAGDASADTSPDMALSHRMRTQIGSVTQQIKDLETNLKRNEQADQSLAELKEIVQNLKQLVGEAAENTDADPEQSRSYQADADKLVTSYNETLNDASFGEEKLFATRDARTFRIFEMPKLEIDSPEMAADAQTTVEATLKELGEFRVELESRSGVEYDQAIRKLQVASQNLAAADPGLRDFRSAELSAKETTAMIEQNAGLAAAAQGHLTSESVFQLLHA